MQRLLLLLPLVVLSACAAPSETCRRDATSHLRTLDALIERTEANIRRGYRIEEDVTLRPEITVCSGTTGWRVCSGNRLARRQRPEPIILEEERAKLASLQETRARAEEEARVKLAACPPPPE